jgi:hypothetical protein
VKEGKKAKNGKTIIEREEEKHSVTPTDGVQQYAKSTDST